MWGTAITALFFVFLIYLGIQTHCEPSLIKQSHCPTKFDHFLSSPPNEIGDTLAGIAGALAFLWIIVTVLLQSQELKSQREELERNRKESEIMNQSMKVQIFENTFFALLKTHNDIVNSIDLAKESPSGGWLTTTGRDCFNTFYNRLRSKYDKYKGNGDQEALETAYLLFWQRHQGELGHYFRFLYRAFKILNENEAAENYHVKLLRSQLSDQELLLLFYNCISLHGSKFKALAEKFALFDNMPLELLFNAEHTKLMNQSAFGDNRLLPSEITAS